MGNMKFKSQICTTKEQSSWLLRLGLKKETADCHWCYHSVTATWYAVTHPYDGIGDWLPAWSLHRLIDMLPHVITGLVISADDKEINMFCYLKITKAEISYWYYNEDGIVECYERFGGNDLYKNVIDIIEFLISENLFEKDYLVQ